MAMNRDKRRSNNEAGADDALPAEVQALLDARAVARKARVWAESDRLRDELAKLLAKRKVS